jgi:hypothetical protein
MSLTAAMPMYEQQCYLQATSLVLVVIDISLPLDYIIYDLFSKKTTSLALVDELADMK